MKFKLSHCALMTLGVFSLAQLQAEHYRLFLLTGQSNALGTTNGGEADVSVGVDPADQHIKFAWSNVVSDSQEIGHSGEVLNPASPLVTFTSLQEQQGGVYGGSASHWGAEIDFSRKLYRAGVRDFGVIKVTRGGGGNSHWHKASSGHMYGEILDAVSEATTGLTAEGHTFEIVGLMYLQGESNNTSEAAVAGTRFKELVDNLRVDLPNASNMHGSIAGIVSAGAAADTTRAEHAAIAESTSYLSYFGNEDIAAYVAADGLHFNKQAKLTIGQRFANRFFDEGVVQRHYGKLVFIGDSITQGGNGNPSYRYQVFKRLAEAGVPIDENAGYKFVGSNAHAYRGGAVTAPDVNGQVFENNHDGHWGWRSFWINGRVALPSNRRNNYLGEGTLLNWTGQADPQEYDLNSLGNKVPYPDPNATGTGNVGVTYVPDTASVMIGINDTGSSSATQIRDDIATIVDQLRGANPEVSIFVCKLLYTSNISFSTVDAVNALLPAMVAEKNALSSASPVWLVDTNEGFEPGSMTYDKVHPNALGEDHVGARIAAAMGIVEQPLPEFEEVLAQKEKPSRELGAIASEGSEIWNSGSAVGGWSTIGSPVITEIAPDDIQVSNPGTSTMLNGTNIGWSEINDGIWSFEARLKFDANPNGYMLWLGTGTHRILIEIHADRTQDYGANSFNVAHNNVDGEFHTFKVTHDPAAGVYRVWRDGVMLTEAAGAPYDQVGGDERLLMGDYTGGSFGNGYDVTVDYINILGGYEGSEIYDGVDMVNGWTTVGGVSPGIVNDTDMQLVHSGGSATWLEGEGSDWATKNDGYYTFEARLKFDANPNGFAIWLENGSNAPVIEIYGDRTQDNGGNDFVAYHNNLDGEYHVFRVGYDAVESVYHVWRDGERLTPIAGASPDLSVGSERLIMGDYTGGSFGNGFDVTVDYIRTDSGNAYLPEGGLNVAPLVESADFNISEIAAIGTDVGSIVANDAEGGALTYQIESGNEAGVFVLDSATGVLSTASGLDYETQESYALTVSVTDEGGLSASAVVVVRVENANEAPRFSYAEFTDVAMEAALYSGSLAGFVEDQDAGESFSFAKLSGPAWLEVAADGTLSGVPQAAAVGENHFTLQVSDSAGATAETSLVISVAEASGVLFAESFEGAAGTDLGNGWIELNNDSRIFDTNRVASKMLISVNSGQTFSVLNELANTFVEGERYELAWNGARAASANGVLHYRVSVGTWDGADFVALSSVEGSLNPVNSGSKVAGESVYVTAGAAAAGLPVAIMLETLEGSSTWVGFDDLEWIGLGANMAPSFNADPILLEAATEDLFFSADMKPFVVESDIADSLSYEKVAGPAWLDVSAEGVVSGTPANGDAGLNVLRVRVIDAGGLSAEAEVQVEVLNTNDEPVLSAGAVSVAEDLAPGSIVTSVQVEDVDVNDSFSYTILSGNVGEAFDIDSDGNIILATALDYETLSSYKLEIEVRDSAGASDQATVVVTVLDVFEVTVPVLANHGVLSTSMDQAEVSYEIVSDGGEAVSLTVLYGELDGGTEVSSWQHSISVEAAESGSYSELLSGLIDGTHYYFTVRAENSAGVSWSSTSSFSTVADLSPKMVRTTVSGVSSDSWTTVDLGRRYNSPVIIATPIVDGETAVVTRVRAAAGSEFEVKIDRVDGEGEAYLCDVSIIAVEEGVYTLEDDGVVMEAVRIESQLTAHSKDWTAEEVSYANSYEAPVVVGQVMSANDPRWSVFWSMGKKKHDTASSKYLHVGKHVGSDEERERASETLGYIVIESGTGFINGVAYEAGLGDQSKHHRHPKFEKFAKFSKHFKHFHNKGWKNDGVLDLNGDLVSASAVALSVTGVADKKGLWPVLLADEPLNPEGISFHLEQDTMKHSKRHWYHHKAKNKHHDDHVGFLIFE
ncbi:cadherin domain-containing protein [Rubritalea tangerina]|uniref:Cadherin domain-containing protein n=1 Tax=Rubritalea tangerina TaxID=430798 RepID=A0ABW4ZEA7_9BACT